MPNELNRNEYIKAIFGNTHRLDIWARIARFSIDPLERFYASELKPDLERTAGVMLHGEIQNLQRLGMIELSSEGGYHEGQIGGQAPKWFVRTDSPAWQIVETALHVVELEFPNPVEE